MHSKQQVDQKKIKGIKKLTPLLDGPLRELLLLGPDILTVEDYFYFTDLILKLLKRRGEER